MSEANWTPVRYVQFEQRCAFCRGRIPKGSPGTRTGERGTKAYFRKLPDGRGEWECMECREEGARADRAREKRDEVVRRYGRPMMNEGDPWDVLVDTRFRVVKGEGALWQAIRGGTEASLRIAVVPVEMVAVVLAGTS